MWTNSLRPREQPYLDHMLRSLILETTPGVLVRTLPIGSDRMDIAFDGLSARAYTVYIPQRPEIRPLRSVVAHQRSSLVSAR